MSHDKKTLDREAVRSVIQQWNANRLDLFALSEPDENLLFHGVMRFYFQDAGQKVATKCIRVASDATDSDVIETLIEKFRPDMRMLSVPNYALYEVHANGEERRLNADEKPLLVQLNWHIDDREGRFLLKNVDQKTTPIEHSDMSFKRKLSKREKKEQKKKEKLAKLNSDSLGSGHGGNGSGVGNTEPEAQVAGKLYTELPETSFTRSISNPEAVMRRRRQQKLEKKLQQFRSRDGGPDTGGTLKIYGESLCQDVPYKTLLLSIRDCAQAVVREMLSKYGLEKADPLHYCLVQVNSDGTEYILDDDECPLSILMNHPISRGSIMFHVRRRPADSQPRRRKKKPLGASNGASNLSSDREGPMLVEVTHSGDGGRRLKLGADPVEVGSANTNCLQLFGPSIQPRHCLVSLLEGVCTVTPLHTDALTFVNGHHITQPTILHNGSVVMFGRVASYRFVDSPTDGRYNLALSQSQLDSACLYESRSPLSPGSWNDEDGGFNATQKSNDYDGTHNRGAGDNSENSIHLHDADDAKASSVIRTNATHGDHHNCDGQHGVEGGIRNTGNGNQGGMGSAAALGQETETKSISSMKSGGSNSRERSPKTHGSAGSDSQGQEPILPAVLEFPETHQELFLRRVITELDVNVPHFKLAPVYSLYLCARYRASTHYRPELQPTERAHKLTVFLHHVANLIYNVVQEQFLDPRVLAFWMANSSEFLHFLKSDRHISAFSIQAQEVLAESVQTAFRNLVNCFRVELSQTLNQFLSETIDHDSAAGLVLTVLGSAMALLRRCRVNAALTIQLFSQLFHYINVICFNTIVGSSHMCTADWGKVMSERLQLLELWAERQGLELAADCHLAKINQCAQFLQAPKTSVEEIQQLACSCFRLNSLQMASLLQQDKIPRNLVDTAIRMAESVADELTRADGREVRLEESPELHLALLLPDDGFSCDVVRSIPSGLVDFLNPLQHQGMCRLAAQPTSVGLWTVYMHQFNMRSSSAMSNKLPQPEMQVIKLHKNTNGMGLSIVAAKGAGQERLGIYIKSVVPGGAADADGRLQAGDQLLRVDGQSLIGITQERAADYLVRTGPLVTLEVAKQGAIYHGLATLLQQPSPIIQRGNRRMSERDLTRMSAESKSLGLLVPNAHLQNSKSVPALHHHTGSSGAISMIPSKSRSTHSLINSHVNNEQGFYQNLSVYRAQNQSQPILPDRSQISSVPHNAVMNASALAAINSASPAATTMAYHHQHEQQQQHQQQQTQGQHADGGTTTINNTNSAILLGRPSSAYYHSNTTTIGGNNQQQHHPHHHHHHQQQQQQQQFTAIHHGHNIVTGNGNSNSNNGSKFNVNGNVTASSCQLQQLPAHSSLTMDGRAKGAAHNLNRDIQNRHSLRMQQMLTPSMPNIAGASTGGGPLYLQHTTGTMSASQSMQNVNVTDSGGQLQYQNGSSVASAAGVGNNNNKIGTTIDYVQQQNSPTGQAMRRLQSQSRHDTLLYSQQQQHKHPHHQQQHHHQHQQLIHNNIENGPQSPNIQQQAMHQHHHQHQHQHLHHQQQQQNSIVLPLKSSSGQLSSPSKQQMAATSKVPHPSRQQQQPPYIIKHQQQMDEKPPLPPTATHPLYKASQQLTPGMNYIASTLDPPKGGYVPIGGGAGIQNQKNFIGTNPWEREEREKEFEMRREHMRLWREQQISDLSTLPQRTPQQDEQLKTLILERDFERRAQEMEEHEDESEPSYEKESLQEVFRLTVLPNAIQTPVTNFRQTEVKLASIVDSTGGGSGGDGNSSDGGGDGNATSSSGQTADDIAASSETAVQHNFANISLTTPSTVGGGGGVGSSQQQNCASVVHPKSILKNNRYDGSTSVIPSSPSKSQKSTSFADDRHLQTEHHHHPTISSLAKDLAQVTLSGSPTADTSAAVPPPPPPERNSSYLVMSQQQQKLRCSNTAAAVASVGLLKAAVPTITSDQNAVKKASIIMNSHNNNNNSNNNKNSNGNSNNNNNNNNNNNSNNNVIGTTLVPGQQAMMDSSALEFSYACNNNNNGSHTLLRDYKRVSFHDDDNNYVTSSSGGGPQYDGDHHCANDSAANLSDTLGSVEAASNYLQQQSIDVSMLPLMPATPDAAIWNTSVQSTPGVIGAQEVYRDPRQRRLAEKQQQQQQRSNEAVPEKLSFKEKMKMFALEAGDDNTPKDKLKISRAQRDIDAVH